jgi:hypothetical protein
MSDSATSGDPLPELQANPAGVAEPPCPLPPLTGSWHKDAVLSPLLLQVQDNHQFITYLKQRKSGGILEKDFYRKFL